MHFVQLLSAGVMLAAAVSPAAATVSVAIDLTHQRMHVTSSRGAFDWPISSARSGFYTPGGSFAPTHLELMHYSRKYDMAPMPHAIFFRGGYAIHGSYETGSLGRPASHGCVRLSPGNATTLYNMVKEEGARISISGTPPATQIYAARARHRQEDEGWASDRSAADGYYADAPYARTYRRRAVPGYAYTPGYGYTYGGGMVPSSGYGYGYAPNPQAAPQDPFFGQ